MKFRLTALMASLAMTNVAFAAVEIDLHRQPVNYIEHLLAQQTNISKMKIEQVRVDTDFNGTTHTRIKQTYEGIPVWDATGVIHTPKTSIKSRRNSLINIDVKTTMNGIIYEGLEKDLSNATAAFTSSSAANALQMMKSLHAKKARLAATVSFQDEKSSPIIFIDENKQAHRTYLTSFTYMTPSEVHRPTSIVDAATHHVYRTWEGILTVNPEDMKAIDEARAKLSKMLENNDPSIPNLYDIVAGGVGGNPKAGEMVYDGGEGHQAPLNMKAVDWVFGTTNNNTPFKITFCVLKDDDITVVDTAMGSQFVISYCLTKSKAHNNVAWLSIDKNMTRWNMDEMNEGYSPSLDAFNSAVMVKKMYQDWFNTPVLIDKEGKPIKYTMRVHFGRKFDNAFWDGKQMTFGDGGGMFYPLTSPGVTAHEMSHGFTETHSGIDFSKPQMGALHESFSDMAAVAVENFMTGKNSWDIGREVLKNEGALRYMDHPTKDGRSIDHMKDYDAMDPHTAGGVTNKVFYLMATTKGWDTHQAFNVWVKANMHYWTSSMSTFADAACGVVAATKDYNYSIADVRVAFAKVGIDTDQCEVR